MGHRFWPLFDLRIHTPRLTLRSVTEADIPAVVASASDIADTPGMFMTDWAARPEPQFSRGLAQFHWRTRAMWKPEDWILPLGVFHEGQHIGQQDIGAENFAVLREVDTGSWLNRVHQGKGFGKEMRAAVLHLGFAGLGAEVARSSYREGNDASLGVSHALGYTPNGVKRAVFGDGIVANDMLLELTREQWEANQGRRVDVEIAGLDDCLEMFGAGTS